MPESARDPAPLLMPRSVVGPLMRLYAYPHPRKPGRVIRGDDRHHALRTARMRSEEHTSELQSRSDLVCRLLLEKNRHGATSKSRITTASNSTKHKSPHFSG